MAEFKYSVSEDEEIYVSDDTEDNKNSHRTRYKRKKTPSIPIGRILGVILIIFFLTYFSMLIYTSNFTMIETEKASYFDVNDYVEVNAYALRNEEYIHNTKGGIIAYVAND